MKNLLEKANKKTLILAGSFLLLIFIIIFGGALLYNKLFYKVSYQEVESIMKQAAIEYLNDKSEKLPSNINDSITITENSLVEAKKMKSISDLTRDKNNNCTGEVIVTNINGNYRYNPILDCGEKYKNIKFVDYIKENINTVNTGNGLYNLNNELVYRGENVDNYLKFSGKIYRIVKIKDDYTILILTDKTEQVNWDDRYNITKKDNSGINDYDISRIKEYLNKVYEENSLIQEQDKLLVSNHKVSIGKRGKDDTNKDGATENSTILENQYISLLPAYDFLNASIDQNCTSTLEKSCSNYNYLAKYNLNWWLATANSNNTHQVYQVTDSIRLITANNSSHVRPVIYLTKDVIYSSGDGTKENPYTVK